MNSINDTSKEFEAANKLAHNLIYSQCINIDWTNEQRRNAMAGALTALHFDMVDHEMHWKRIPREQSDLELVNEYVQLSSEYLQGVI